MKAQQMFNLLEFTSIFLSGDIKLKLQSSDYYKEKYDKYIGFKSNIINYETTDFYEEWLSLWKDDSVEIKNMFLYFQNIINIAMNKKRDIKKHWLINITPNEMINSFEKYIGPVEYINEYRYSHVHALVKRDIYDVWIKNNLRLIKFLKITN